MRRLALVVGTVALAVSIPAPAHAVFSNAAQNPFLHVTLDVLAVAALTAPLWTYAVWGGRYRWALIPLVALVQVPLGAVAFLPLADPRLHLAALLGALGLTAVVLSSARLIAGPQPRQPRRAAKTARSVVQPATVVGTSH